MLLLIESLSFTYAANGLLMRQMLDSSWEFLKIENEQITTAQKIIMDKNLRETTNLCVEIMNSIGDKQRGNLVTWYKFPFAVWRKGDVNLSNLSKDIGCFEVAWRERLGPCCVELHCGTVLGRNESGPVSCGKFEIGNSFLNDPMVQFDTILSQSLMLSLPGIYF